MKEINDENLNEEVVDVEESYEDLKKRRNKNIIISLIVCVITVGIVALLWFKSYDIINFIFEDRSSVTASSPVVEETEENIDEVNEYIEEGDVELDTLYQEVHYMANTLIIAEDGQIWGKENINKDSLDEILKKLKNNEEYLYNELFKWKKLDFSNAIEVHNYVWGKFRGTIGEATDINEEGVQAAIKALSE